MIRLHVGTPLAAGASVEISEGQARYLTSVMRRAVGDIVHLFNGQDGEWAARISAHSRARAVLTVEDQVLPQSGDLDVWLMFALLKRDTTDLVVQKATELGVAALLPVFTERTNAGRTNLDRLRAIAVEAAEQSERLTVPTVLEPRQLRDSLAAWPQTRPLFVARERLGGQFISTDTGPAGLLVGPEGGFGPQDLGLLDRCDFIQPISLGPRILRAETAAIVGLALLQAPRWG